MKSRSWLTLLVLLGAAAGASAQPYRYGPPPVPPGYGPMPMPYGGAPYPTMPEKPVAPARPAAPTSAQVPAPRTETPPAMPSGPAAEAGAVLKEGMDKLLGSLAREEVPNRLQVSAFLDRAVPEGAARSERRCECIRTLESTCANESVRLSSHRLGRHVPPARSGANHLKET
jgi:phospholipid transport system substrate-binding protein